MSSRTKQRRTAGAVVAASGMVVALAGGLFNPASALLDDTTSTVDQTVSDTTDTVNKTITTVNDTVDTVEKTVNDTVDEVEKIIDDTVDELPPLPIDPDDLPPLPDIDKLPEIPDLPGVPELGLPGSGSGTSSGNTTYDVHVTRNGSASTPGRSGGAGGSGGSGGSGDAGGAGGAGGRVGPMVRSNELIVDFMQNMEATDAALRDVMAPFPVASDARFLDEPGDRTAVEIDSERGGSAIAVVDGTVGSVTRDADSATLVLWGDDGSEYEYRGLWVATDLPESGDDVVAGSVLGRIAGESLEFSAGPDTETFLEDALTESTAKAAAYAIAALADAFGESFDTALASNVVDEVPRPLVAAAALALVVAGGGLALTAPAVAPAGVTTAPSRRRRPLVARRG